MKKLAVLAAVVLMGLPLVVQAEPMAFEQAANVTGLTGIEIGTDFDYSYEKIEQQGSVAVENTMMDLPIFVRIGLPVMEIKVSAPYGNVKSNLGTSTDTTNFKGMKNVGLMVKTGLLALPIFNLGVGLATKFPTAEPEKYVFGEGLALNPFVAADLDIVIMKLHANLGYEYRGEYNRSFNPLTNEPLTNTIKLKPGDATHWALGVEVPTGDLFFLEAELLGTKYGEVKIDTQAIPDTSGSTMTFVPGLRLQKGPFKAKIGYGIPLEKKEERPDYAPRSDWRIIGGISLCFGF